MLRYFVSANVWLFLAAVAYVGKTVMRGQPDLYAVFGVGRWFNPSAYSALIIAPSVLSIIYFALWLGTMKSNTSQPTHQ